MQHFDDLKNASDVALAFDYLAPVHFVKNHSPIMVLCTIGNNSHEIELSESATLRVVLGEHGATFARFDNESKYSISLKSDGSLFRVNMKIGNPLIIAKGLFRLGFLTGEVESALNIHPTFHEKIEWGIEYENMKKAR